jgi:hypothetical protein
VEMPSAEEPPVTLGLTDVRLNGPNTRRPSFELLDLIHRKAVRAIVIDARMLECFNFSPPGPLVTAGGGICISPGPVPENFGNF